MDSVIGLLPLTVTEAMCWTWREAALSRIPNMRPSFEKKKTRIESPSCEYLFDIERVKCEAKNDFDCYIGEACFNTIADVLNQ